MDYSGYGDYTATSGQSAAGVTGFWIGYMVVLIIVLIAGWRVFSKAKKPGWAIIIPIYNIYVILKIVGRPGWWVLLYFIPLVNIIVHLVVSLDLAKSFGRSGAFGIFFLWLFSVIGFLVLGFGKSQYKGPSVK